MKERASCPAHGRRMEPLGLTCGKLVSGFRPQRSSYCFAAAADDDAPECLAKKSKVLGQEAAACSRYLGEPRLANAWAASRYE